MPRIAGRELLDLLVAAMLVGSFLVAATLVGSLVVLGSRSRSAASVDPSGAGDHVATLHVETLGAGTGTIAFLPGLGSTGTYWSGLVTPLPSTYRVFLVDPLGFGASPRPQLTYTIAAQAAALAGALTGQDSVVLVGHSLGALVSATYAAAHPERVRALVLISAPLYHNKREAVAQLGRQGVMYRWVLSHRVATAVFCIMARRVALPLIPLLDPSQPEVRPSTLAHNWRSSSSSLHDGLYGVDGYAVLNALPAALPVLVLHGGRDETAPGEHMEVVLDQHPTWHRVWFPDLDHHPVVRAPKQVMNAIELFVGSLETPSVGRQPQGKSAGARLAPT